MEIITLKFKKGTVTFQKDVKTYSKYFLTAHAPILTIKLF